MSKTFFNSGPSSFAGDKITLIRFAGPINVGGNRHCLQITTQRKSAISKTDRWAGHTIAITREEAIVLRDNLTRFINGVKDSDEEETFQDHPERCNCVFYTEQDKDAWHYLRLCKNCNKEYYSLHCKHDGVQKPCPHCSTIPARIEAVTW